MSLLHTSTAHGSFPAAFYAPAPFPLPSSSTAGVLKQHTSSSSSLQCNAISKPRTQEFIDAIQNGLPVIKWHEVVEDDVDKDSLKEHASKIRPLVGLIQSMLKSMGDGEITVSPYDTAWVALVPDIGGAARPQFPQSLDWISKNQLSDGSWGATYTFSIYDRIINTLACVIALKTWNIHPKKSHKGIRFIKKNIHKLEDENMEHMPIGFEVALPSLIDIAKKVGIDIPDDGRGLQEIYERRELKLKRIPKDMMHELPTTLLHSLEGMPGLMWQKLLKLQCQDGSFLFSPSSTAFALQQTKDHNCLNYLTTHLHKFNGGVPNVYPVDLFERMWAVDRIGRLGISRYFQAEFDECISYVHRYWTDKGICWARNSVVEDIDDTAMGFRLLRMHGYEVSADVFKHFKKGEVFFCFRGQSTQAVTGMYNLYRASQLMFPGEDILVEAANFSSKFLQHKRANNELLDKWIITKDLPGEVGYALDVPWYASLPRIETRFYLEQYGGEDDVWIGKTLYKMPYVNNNKYLELAKSDYNNCQMLHQQECRNIQKWYRNCGLGELGLSESKVQQAYFVAASCVYEPEKSVERLAWAKTAILVETVTSLFDRQQLSREQKRAFLNDFENGSILKYGNAGRYKSKSIVGALIRTISHVSLDILLAHGRDIHQPLQNSWHKWLKALEEGGDIGESNAELLVQTLNLSGSGRHDHCESENSELCNSKYEHLLKVTMGVCSKLRLFQQLKDGNGCMSKTEGVTTLEIELEMQELVKLVFTKSSDDLDNETKQNFFTIAKSFYYVAYCNPGTINFHIAKVLFEKVL